MKCLVFGAISSPFQAIFVVLQHAQDFKAKFPSAYHHVHEALYMDDIASGESDKDKAKEAVDQLVQLFDLASMKTHKWVSNDPAVLKMYLRIALVRKK